VAAVVRHVAAAFIGAYVAVSTTTTATVPATQKATTMSDLIPQSAIDAALKRAEAETHAPNYSCFMPSEAYAAKLLDSAAPHIAARALRRAAADFSDPNLSDWETALVRSYLLTRANKLKANTAFTELVQLGQEIGDN